MGLRSFRQTSAARRIRLSASPWADGGDGAHARGHDGHAVGRKRAAGDGRGQVAAGVVGEVARVYPALYGAAERLVDLLSPDHAGGGRRGGDDGPVGLQQAVDSRAGEGGAARAGDPHYHGASVVFVHPMLPQSISKAINVDNNIVAETSAFIPHEGDAQARQVGRGDDAVLPGHQRGGDGATDEVREGQSHPEAERDEGRRRRRRRGPARP